METPVTFWGTGVQETRFGTHRAKPMVVTSVCLENRKGVGAGGRGGPPTCLPVGGGERARQGFFLRSRVSTHRLQDRTFQFCLCSEKCNFKMSDLLSEMWLYPTLSV